jgi:hypothetical protein
MLTTLGYPSPPQGERPPPGAWDAFMTKTGWAVVVALDLARQQPDHP